MQTFVRRARGVPSSSRRRPACSSTTRNATSRVRSPAGSRPSGSMFDIPRTLTGRPSTSSALPFDSGATHARNQLSHREQCRRIWHPMAHPKDMQDHPPRIIMKGEGIHVTDIEGKTVLDAVGGLWNVTLGYSCDPIKKAMADQLKELPYYSGFRGVSTGPAIELAYELTEWFKPEGMVRAFFTSGGSDSVETALRLARQYWKIKGQRDRTKFRGAEEGLSRHAFRRRIRQRQCQFPPQLRAAAVGRLSHPLALDLPQSLQRDRPCEARAAPRQCALRRDRIPGRRHHRRLHHGAAARCRRRHRAAFEFLGTCARSATATACS